MSCTCTSGSHTAGGGGGRRKAGGRLAEGEQPAPTGPPPSPASLGQEDRRETKQSGKAVQPQLGLTHAEQVREEAGAVLHQRPAFPPPQQAAQHLGLPTPTGAHAPLAPAPNGTSQAALQVSVHGSRGGGQHHEAFLKPPLFWSQGSAFAARASLCLLSSTPPHPGLSNACWCTNPN